MGAGRSEKVDVICGLSQYCRRRNARKGRAKKKLLKESGTPHVPQKKVRMITWFALNASRLSASSRYTWKRACTKPRPRLAAAMQIAFFHERFLEGTLKHGSLESEFERRAHEARVCLGEVAPDADAGPNFEILEAASCKKTKPPFSTTSPNCSSRIGSSC